MISNIHRNIMGTASFDGKFPGMRKPQDFIVYPMHTADAAAAAKIQSDTRIGAIDLATGAVRLSPPRAGGSYGVHLALATDAGKLSGEELLALKAAILATAGGRVGSRCVVTDNSGALEVFGGAA
mgnify:CR=1 FL=1